MKKTGTIMEFGPNEFPLFSKKWWACYFLQEPMLVKSKYGKLISKSEALKIWQEEAKTGLERAKKNYKDRIEYLKKLRNSS